MRKWQVGGLILLVVVGLLEFSLRLGWGFGRPPLVYADHDFGYAYRANQQLRRFGNRVFYNGEGLRSEPIQPYVNHILCVGDSVTNGGTQTDQSDTYPYQLERQLRAAGHNVQALNASANGWALENEFGFIRKKGIFSASTVVFEVGSHDLYQRMAPDTIPGSDPNFPVKPPVSAIYEMTVRYLLPKAPGALRQLAATSSEEASHHIEFLTDDDYHRCLGTLEEMVALAELRKAQVIILLVPNRQESEAGRYERDHLADLQYLARQLHCRFVDLMPVLHESFIEKHNPYRDFYHPNSFGDRLMALSVRNAILQEDGSFASVPVSISSR